MNRLRSAVFATGAVLSIIGSAGIVAVIPAALELGAFTEVVLWGGSIALMSLIVGLALMFLAD